MYVCIYFHIHKHTHTHSHVHTPKTVKKAPPGQPWHQLKILCKPMLHCIHILLSLSYNSSHVLLALHAPAFGHLKKICGTVVTANGNPSIVPFV